MVNSQILKLLALLLFAITLVPMTACGIIEREIDEKSTAEELYRSAKRDLRNGNFLTAVETFETLGARFPFGNFTQQAQLDLAYAYHRQDEHDNAIATASFILAANPSTMPITSRAWQIFHEVVRLWSDYFPEIWPRLTRHGYAPPMPNLTPW